MNRRAVLLGSMALAACSEARSLGSSAPYLASRGVNLGNALDAPNEGDWGYRIEASDIRAIAHAGFDGVRLPVRWDAHAGASAPYTIAPALLDRVEEVIVQALGAGLKVQLDAHHYDALIANPDTERARFLAIWDQIARRFSDAPHNSVAFEPLNEPFGAAWNGELLSGLQAEVIGAIRALNPERAIVLGPGNWQSIDALNAWTPPQAERIAVSVHYYEPYAFTHQHASWLGVNAPAYPRAWGKSEDVARIGDHISAAAHWARARGLPLQIGEFGANAAAPLGQRARWTKAVRQACEREGAAWSVWDFAGAFPIFDRQSGRFLPPMVDALGLC